MDSILTVFAHISQFFLQCNNLNLVNMVGGEEYWQVKCLNNQRKRWVMFWTFNVIHLDQSYLIKFLLSLSP